MSMTKASRQNYIDQVSDSTLYVLANRTDAVFYLDGRDKRFHFAGRLINKKGDRMELELISDRPGTGVSSAVNGATGVSGFRRHDRTAY